MNEWTALTIVAIAIVVLTAFTFYLTASAWSFLLLIFLPTLKESSDNE